MVYDFTGRLSFSWPRTAAQAALNVGDADYDPLFPYGYGLTLAADGNLPQLSEASGLTEISSATEGIYFDDGRAQSGYALKVGTDRGNLLTVHGQEQVSAAPSVLMADYEVQGDASLLLWRPGLPGYFAVTAEGQPLDLQREANDGLSLALLLKVEESPRGPVSVGMRDADGQLAQVDVTSLLEAGRGWRQYRFGLRCFEERGVDMQKITVPLELHTTDAARLVLAEIRLATVEEGDAVCPGRPDA